MLDMIFLMIAAASGGGAGGGNVAGSASATASTSDAPAAIVAAPSQEAPDQTAPATTVFAGGKDADSASARTSATPPAAVTTFLAPTQEAPTTAFLAPTQETQTAPATAFLAPAAEPQTGAAPMFLAPNADQAATVPTFLAPQSGLVAEPQTPTGRFTTALEVKPILNATRANWINVREYDGKDLLYVTHLWSWRCGLLEMRIGLNGNPPEVWPMPQCHLDQQSPAAILDGDGLPYAEFPLGALALIEVQITYDDLSTDSAKFNRNGMLVP